MEGFFYGADVAFATLAPSATTHGVTVKAPIPSSEPIPREKGTYTERVSETTPIPAKTPISPEGVIPAAAQAEAISPILPLVISTSDPFTDLSQAVKDGSSLVLTPSSIPSYATRGPDADLSSKESKDILEDPEDEPVLKKRNFDFNEKESASPKTEFVGIFVSFFFFLLFIFNIYICIYVASCCNLPFICMSVSLFVETFEGLGVAANVGMPSAVPFATPIAHVSVVPSVHVFVLPTAPIITGPGEFPFPLSPPSFFFSMSLSLLDHGLSFHALCFLDSSTPYCSFSV